MKKNAILSVILATIAMLIYIFARFRDIKFALAAVMALLQDVLVVITFYAVFRVPVGNTFIACMLTIVGYSINGTIIIFDRIREMLKSANREEAYKLNNDEYQQKTAYSIYCGIIEYLGQN